MMNKYHSIFDLRLMILLGCFFLVSLSPTFAGTVSVNGGNGFHPVQFFRWGRDLYRAYQFRAGLRPLIEFSKKIPAGECRMPSPKVLLKIEEHYQRMTDKIVANIRKIQVDNPNNLSLNRKGYLENIKIKIIENCNELDISYWEEPYGLSSEIRIPIRTLTGTLQYLRAAYKKKNQRVKGALKVMVWFDQYVPLIEFEEVMRFAIVHEATHLWLHESWDDIKEREIDADAWGIELSSSMSDAFKSSVKADRARRNGASLRSIGLFEKSLIYAKSGERVFFNIYGKRKELLEHGERQGPEERLISIGEKRREIVTNYSKSLKLFDSLIYAIEHSSFFRELEEGLQF